MFLSGNPPQVTGMAEFGKRRLALLSFFAAAAATQDATNEKRKKNALICGVPGS